MATPKLRFKEFDGDWSAQKYKDALTIKYGKDHKLLEDGEIPVYGTGGVMRYVNQYLYDGESILIGRKGTIDQPKYVNEKFWTVDTLFYSEIKQNIYPLFIYQHALQVNWLGLNEATGVPSLNTTSINNVDIYLPSKEEQTKIASFLSAVDEKISQLTQKNELLSQYKQGMMQKLFSLQIRFKADDGSEFGEWVLSELDPYIQESKDSSKIQDEYEVLTSSRRGLIRQAEYFEDSRLADRENIGFNIIQPNQITYRSRSDDGLFFFNLNELNITGIISTYYPVFTMKNGNNKFFYECLNFHKHKYIQYAVGTSQLVLSLNQLRKIKFRIPCIEEQTKIANFLSAIDEKIEVVAQQIEQAKKWKKGLLQQMFV
ncbi:restriction endonuclease subunit S [Acinetobacter sp. 226]|uniref:restriction endonuclease subunit S n=1 Tax=Acinetobacter sp. 226 TaxID=3114699 RepID=UPI003A87CCA6